MNRNQTIMLAFSIMALSSVGGMYYLQSQARAGRRVLVVSTTTSLYDTGILDEIEEAFEAENQIDLYFVAAGTGFAIAQAKRGDADVILVHAPSEEIAFLESGHGVCRKIIAYNYFSIVGPGADPAGVEGMPPGDALLTLLESGRAGEATWVSRGDGSGTHVKEKGLWSSLGHEASALSEEGWYREAGAGMGKTLQMAEEFGAYTLTDMGTYLKYREVGLIDLEALVVAGRGLINVYSAIAVNPEANPDTDFESAITFISYLVSEEGQAIFENYGVDTYGTNLFNPAVELLKTGSDPTTVNWIETAAYFEGSECPMRFRAGMSMLYG